MSDLIERPADAADPTYPDAERCAQTLEACEDDLLTEAQFVRWQGQEIERLRQWETCGQEWLGKTDWVQERMNAGSWPISALGKHRADVMREEIERLTEWNRQMVEKAASGGRLDGYRELADRAAAAEIERDQLRQQLAEARQRAEYWKAEHLAGNKEIDELRRQLDPMGEYTSADELIAALRAEKAKDDAMKRDAECWRELDQMMSDPDAELNVNAGGWAVLKCGLLGKLGASDA